MKAATFSFARNGTRYVCRNQGISSSASKRNGSRTFVPQQDPSCRRNLCVDNVYNPSASTVPSVPSSSGFLQVSGLDLVSQRRWLANGAPPKRSFIENLVSSIQKDLEKNKELQENLKKLKAEADKLDHSDALKQARAKYQLVEQETLKTSEVVKKNLEKLTEQMKQVIEEAKKTEYGKKAALVGEQVLKTTREAAEQLEKSAEALGNTQTYKTVASSMHAVKVEIDDLTVNNVRMYRKPERLTLRSEHAASFQRTVEINTDATSVELHKEAKWYQSFKSWTDNNPAINKMWDWKMKYDESDNPMVRVSRFVTDRITNIFASRTEVSEVLTEIAKVDPGFTKDEFLRFCESLIIPNVLEAMIRADLDVLKDWCHEIAFRQISTPIQEALKIGYWYDSKILDISHVDLAAGKMMEQGPVLIVTFQAHQTDVVRNRDGKVVEGDPEVPIRVSHVWVLCRDMEELNPRAAWKLLELHQQPQNLAL